MDTSYGAHYRALYEKHWWWRARESVILDALRRHGAYERRQNILDIGCGDGLFFDRLSELGDVEGVEPGAELVDPNGRWANRIHVAPFDTRFRPSRPYSTILMLDVLEHLEHPAAALRHALALLEPGGLMLITVPAFRALWTSHDVVNHHFTRFTRRSFRAVAHEASFGIREERYFFQWTVPAKLAVRAVESVRAPRDALPAMPPALINSALRSLSRLEYRLLAPLGVPFGSSLLIAGGHAAR